jgi:hypothetical protein
MVYPTLGKSQTIWHIDLNINDRLKNPDIIGNRSTNKLAAETGLSKGECK